MEHDNFSLLMEHAIAEIKDQAGGWQQLYRYHSSFDTNSNKKDAKENFSISVHYNGRDTIPYRLINEVPVQFQPLLLISGLVDSVITHIY